MSLLDKNLTLLKVSQPELAERMARTEPAEVEVTPNYERDAKDFVTSRVKNDVDANVVLGMALGHVPLEISKTASQKGWIVGVEGDDGLFRAALEKVDLTPLLTRSRTRLFIGKDLREFQAGFYKFLGESEAMLFNLIECPWVTKEDPAFYRAAAAEIQSGITRRTVELSTLIRHAESMDTNAIRNQAANARAHGVKDFEGLLEGIPAIVVGAGPSLNEAIPHLKKVKGKACILSVSKALKKLLAEGIQPDFVLHLDMIRAGKECLEGFAIPPDLPLVYDPDAYWQIPQGYSGPLITYKTHTQVDQWAERFLGDRGTLKKGLSVSHTAFYFARHLKADPIMLVGVDCAFPGERTHADGVTMTWGGSTKSHEAKWIEIPGADGQPVKSLQSFAGFVAAFEVEIPHTHATVIQTSEHGALIRGAEHLSLEKAIDRYARDSRPFAYAIDQALEKEPYFDEVAFRKAMRDLRQDFEAIEELTDAGFRMLKKLRRLDISNKLDRPELQRASLKLNAALHAIFKLRYVPKVLERLMSGPAMEVRKIQREIDSVTPSPINYPRLLDQQEVTFKGYRDCARFFVKELDLVGEQLGLIYVR